MLVRLLQSGCKDTQFFASAKPAEMRFDGIWQIFYSAIGFPL
jgi:hypothetical protein